MALIHTEADLHPDKLDLLGAWVPQQAWGSDAQLAREATFRLDDPAGEVGIETFLLRAGDDVLHVPLTYRGAPLDGGTLVGELEHSVLGHRWVYDAATDPVYVETVTRVVLEGGQQATLEAEDGAVLTPSTGASAQGSGVAPGTTAGPLEVVRRPLAQPGDLDGAAGALTATWAGQDHPVALVLLLP